MNETNVIKEVFECPKAEIAIFSAIDIITLSNGAGLDDGEPDMY